MQSTAQIAPNQVTIESFQRQRKRVRQACWVGLILSLLAFVVVIGQSLLVRWRLQRHGWVLVTNLSDSRIGWIREWGDPWFGRIEWASLHEAALNIGDVQSLREIAPQIATVQLVSTVASESDLAAISKFPELAELVLFDVQVESTGLHHLASIPKLQSLGFCMTRIPEDTLKHVAVCRGVTRLTLTDLSDHGLLCLSSLPWILSLELSGSRLTDVGAKQLAHCFPNLESLEIFGARMTDEGLSEFTHLRKLHHLILDEMPITDEGIQQLGGCPALSYLLLQRTKVTASGVTELRASRPRLNVSIN